MFKVNKRKKMLQERWNENIGELYDGEKAELTKESNLQALHILNDYVADVIKHLKGQTRSR